MEAPAIRLPEGSKTMPRIAPLDASWARQDKEKVMNVRESRAARMDSLQNKSESSLDGRQLGYSTGAQYVSDKPEKIRQCFPQREILLGFSTWETLIK
jgi:hypothetical protein